MPKPLLNRRLTPTDASFLYLERDEAPMHIGAIAIVDGELDFEGYMRSVRSKLPRLPRFLQKVVPAPFNLGHPTWESDPEFDIRHHVFLHEIAEPGGEAELTKAAGERVFTGVLDRQRPLWELHVMRGLAGGRSAVVSKVHHAMVDGVGSNELVNTLFDLRPTPPPDEVPELPMAADEERPGLSDAMWANAMSAVETWSKYSLAVIESARNFTSEQARITLQAVMETVPDLALPLRLLPFNRPGSRHRRVVGTAFSFSEARAVRGALVGTVNDVILAVLALAIAKYAEHHGLKLEGRSLRVMVPVNVRPRSESASLGNQVSVLPVSLPLDVRDPEKLLHAIHGTTRILKTAKVADGIHQMSQIMGVVPPPVQAAMGSLATPPLPLFNMVCTNVPGPQIPIYALEHPVVEYYPSVPVGYRMGLGCSIYSYNQKLWLGLTADTEVCPDVSLVRDFLDEAIGELRAAAGVETIEHIDTTAAGGSAKQPVRKAAVKRQPARKTGARKTGARRTGTKKAVGQKPATKRAAAKKAAAKRQPARKTGAKQPKSKATVKPAAGQRAEGSTAGPPARRDSGEETVAEGRGKSGNHREVAGDKSASPAGGGSTPAGGPVEMEATGVPSTSGS